MVWRKSFFPQTSPHDRPPIYTQTIAKRRIGSQTCKMPLARHLTMSNIFNESSPSVFWTLEKGFELSESPAESIFQASKQRNWSEVA